MVFKALYNRGVHTALQKKLLKNLHICNFCSTFAADFVNYYDKA